MGVTLSFEALQLSANTGEVFPLNIVPLILHALLGTLTTAHFILHLTLNIVHCTLNTAHPTHRTLYTGHFTLYTEHFT